MKYRDSDINLIRNTETNVYTDFVPRKDFLYLKVLHDGTILFSIGDISKNVFNKSNRWLTSKNLRDINIEFFNDYILNMIHRVANDLSAYQFNFQYKGRIITYVCSIHPCLIYDHCRSFDIIIRKNDTRKSNASFFMSLQNSTV